MHATMPQRGGPGGARVLNLSINATQKHIDPRRSAKTRQGGAVRPCRTIHGGKNPGASRGTQDVLKHASYVAGDYVTALLRDARALKEEIE
jgi:hypothetical protein